MSDYRHPYKDVAFVINELVDFEQFCNDANLQDINSELVSVICQKLASLALRLLLLLMS